MGGGFPGGGRGEGGRGNIFSYGHCGWCRQGRRAEEKKWQGLEARGLKSKQRSCGALVPVHDMMMNFMYTYTKAIKEADTHKQGRPVHDMEAD